MSTTPVTTSRTRGALLLVLVFAAGAVVGAAVARLLFRGPVVIQTSGTPRPIDPEMIPRPLEALGLTDEQKAQLRVIARQWRPRAGVELHEFSRKVSELENGMFADMVCVLTAEQRGAYRSQLEENGAPSGLIDKRFQRVRDNTCNAR